jgi:hypothetical protein
MGLFDKEEITAPSIEAAVAEAIKPVAVVAPVNRGAECTRDTRGDADCAVKDCENCN